MNEQDLYDYLFMYTKEYYKFNGDIVKPKLTQQELNLILKGLGELIN